MENNNVMPDADDFSEEETSHERVAEEFERHRKGLYERICEYMEEDIDEAYVAHLLLDAAISMRMTAYGSGAENPSAAGLKLELNRLRGELDRLVRDGKRGAEEFINKAKEMRAAIEEEDEDGAE
jgi:hypothetical protein